MAETLLSCALVTQADAKSSLGLNLSVATYDDQVNALVNYISELFEGVMNGRRIVSTVFSSISGVEGATDIDALDGDNSSEIWLPQYPVSALTTLKVDGDEISERADLDSDGWVLEKASGRIRLVGDVFLKGTQNIDLTFTAGYAAVPKDLRLVALLEIKRAWAKAYKNEVGKSSEADAQGNRTWIIKGLLPETEKVLARYRKRNAW